MFYVQMLGINLSYGPLGLNVNRIQEVEMSILTISEKVRADIGGKEFRAFQITVASAQAGSLTVTAASCGMNKFDHVMAQGGAMTGADIGDWFLSTTAGDYVDFNVTSADIGDVVHMWAIGT